MALLWINNISISFGGPQLIDRASLQIEAGERIGLLGRNGSGKSTLMKLLNRDLVPDAGEISGSGDVRVALMPQDIEDLPGTVYDVVAAGDQQHLDLLHEYHDLSVQLTRSNDQNLLKKMERVHHQLEAAGAWQYSQKVEAVISRTSLDADAEFRLLSAGMKRRVLLARALVSEPDILLLDEPTNHLDIHSILWLEEFLQNYDKTILFVTHDRTFLQKIATRIVEIDRGKLFSFACNYSTYLERRQAMQEAEESQWQTFDKKLAKEEVWVRQGIKARRTRNEGRVRALMVLREERARRREREGSVKLAIQEAERSGKLVVEADKISFAYDNRKIIDSFSTTIIRGDKIGIIGPNGSGKTTLLKVLLGELPVSGGKIRLGTGIAIAYFDQLRAQFDDSKSLRDNIAGGNDTVFINGMPRHIVGYLQDFLFPPEQIKSPVASLSGGERNRLLLARLFATPSNVLVLDEPTNDLDAETLELLEDRLLEYTGTILLVSHDRTFLNNVVTSTIVLEGEGRLQEYVGGYDDWLRQRACVNTQSKPAAKETKAKKEKQPKEKSKLSFKETKELEELPQKIEKMEKEKEQLVELLNSADLYKTNNPSRVLDVNNQLAALEANLEKAYARWDELEEMAAKFST
ncbi:MAG: ABC transporter ATP-binding protein [Deltaproteobacteria bacterium HGW-Deltaproteobacteria-6]|nr:MAG: ABC transporter ATP-binding protein [Deltaproteobacteria bacterium HGW-Deltaproteobacteria-6]